MRNEALYQKYRSQNFDEVVGQEYVVRSVRNAIQQGKVGHAYLFCGPRGTGKTTMARLLARAVNCENPSDAPCGECENCKAAMAGNHPDIIEINAANETHVEDIRDLIERARLAPMMGKHKIYIIDEVHQLSSSAASALLKTLEEPPEHIIFILATTDPQKLLSTIISRCQRFDFSKVSMPQIRDHLLNIAAQENMYLEPKAAEKIAFLADGGMRDALSMLEQAASYANRDIHEKDIDAIYGLASTGEKLELLNAVSDGDLAKLLERIEGYENSGLDLKRLTMDLIDALKDSVIYSYTKNASLLRTLNEEQASALTSRIMPASALTMIEMLMKANEDYKTAQSVSSVFEVACMKMIVGNPTVGIPTNIAPKPAFQETSHVQKYEENVAYTEPEPLTERTPAPVTETPHVTPAIEPKAEPIANFNEPVVKQPDITVEMIVALLVQCDKESKAQDAAKLNDLLNGLRMDRYIAALKQTELTASGKDCILFTTQSQTVADTMNETQMNKGLYLCLTENCGIDKMVFVATETMYKEAVRLFVELRSTGKLPQPLAIERYSNTEEKKGEAPTPEAKLRSLLEDDEILEVYE